MPSKNMKREFILQDGGRLTVDSGQVTAYRPAQHNKPQAQSLLNKIGSAFRSVFQRVPASLTTEKGAAGTASPSTYELTLIQQRYDRWQVIADCRRMVEDDPRARISTLKFAGESVRNGFTITVDGNSARDKKARAIADKIQDIVNPKASSWAWMLITEGDLFIQAIATDGELLGAKRMPAASMERLTDDTDEFIDPEHAFEQIDVNTQDTVATFCEAVMFHARWDEIDGERYGYPAIIAGRRLRRLLELTEEGQVVRRLTRAPQRTLWNVGTPENPGKETAVKDFKTENGFVEGRRDIFDPNNVALDFFSNGLADAKVIHGDPHVHEVDDIKYLQNLYASTLPTPPPIYNLDSESVNRDVLEDLRAEWLKETAKCTKKMYAITKWLFELGLLLADILPETIKYSLKFAESTIERPDQVVERIVKLRSQNPPLISFQRGVQIIAEITNCDDPEAEMALIEKELQDKQAADLEQQKKISTLSNGNGKALNGKPAVPAN